MYFENTYIQSELELKYDNPDCLACVTIDGYDDSEEIGRVIAEMYLTKHGDIVTSWHDNTYRLSDSAIEIVNESRQILEEIWAETEKKTENRLEKINRQLSIAKALLSKCNHIIKNVNLTNAIAQEL